MTKKDFILVASAINAQRYALGMDNKQSQTALDELTQVLAGRFADVNPRFDSTKFYQACGFVSDYKPFIS